MELMGDISARYDRERKEYAEHRISRMQEWLRHAVEMANEQTENATSESVAYWEGYRDACSGMILNYRN